MPVKTYKPTTPSRRYMSVSDFSELTKNKKPEKKLTIPKKSKAGRSKGKITVRHRGGGHKRKYRVIDFRQNRLNIPAKVKSIEYDPNRSSFIALIVYKDGQKSYILAPNGIRIGDEIVFSKDKIDAKIGNRMPLSEIPIGMQVHNIELEKGKGGQIVRSAGAYAQVMSKEGNYVQLKFPSGEIRNIQKDCMASIGQLSNIEHENIVIGKAGRKRWLGIRPTVRGKAMTPRDHPHGGGEGGCPIGMIHPKTPWGKPALGVKTRKKGKKSDKFIIKRRK